MVAPPHPVHISCLPMDPPTSITSTSTLLSQQKKLPSISLRLVEAIKREKVQPPFTHFLATCTLLHHEIYHSASLRFHDPGRAHLSTGLLLPIQEHCSYILFLFLAHSWFFLFSTRFFELLQISRYFSHLKTKQTFNSTSSSNHHPTSLPV